MSYETELPANWRGLKNSQKFAALRDSASLLRGSTLPNIEVDCRKRRVADDRTQVELKFNYPTREEGSFTFKNAQGRIVMGGLEVLSSDSHRYDRIFVLSRPITFEGGKSVPHELAVLELAYIARLLETYENQCSSASGHHIAAYAILVKGNG